MRITPEKALKTYEDLMRRPWKELSESDTRSKLIDTIFKNCLNWQEEDIVREEHSDTGYVDYIFRLGTRNVFVVEAKKKGCSFKLPVAFGFVRQYKVGGLLSKDKTIRDVLDQARRYCIDKGARFGVISNGDQFILFEAYKIGEEWNEGNCLVFYNPDDIDKNFIDFWNILSKDCVERGSLVDSLSKEIEELTFTRPVDNVHFRNELQPRNELHRYMIPIIEHAFKEITTDDKIDMLKKCYVLEREFQQQSEALRSYFSADLKSSGFKEIVQGEETAGVFLADFYKYADELKRAPPEPIVFLVLGGIGSGKTTFIFRFFNVVLLEEEREKIKWFYIDFRDAPIEEVSIRDHILKGILDEFKTKHKSLFEKTLASLKMEKVSPCMDDISKLFLVLKYEGFIPSLVIDNVDQHRVESSTFHEKVFLEANNLTKEFRTITIMTLREESFYKSQVEGVFDAYFTERYTIAPPDFRKVLLYRLQYILEKLSLPTLELQRFLHANLDSDVQRKTLSDFLKIVKDTLYISYNRSVSRFVARTTGGNMRRSLELFSNFLVSGNTKVKEMLDTYRRGGSYTIAEHQFVKSIVLGNYRYYSDDYSYLLNIFDFNMDFSTSHFLKLRVLRYAEDRVTTGSPYGRGYVSINRLNEEAREISVPHEAIEDVLVELAKHGLVTLDTHSRTDLTKASHFTITDCGNYYLHVLPRRFSYIDLVLADTPIADVDVALKIRHMLPSRELDTRFQRCELFIRYLDRMEEREIELNPDYELSSLGKYRFTKQIIHSFEREKEYIHKRIAEKSWTLDTQPEGSLDV